MSTIDIRSGEVDRTPVAALAILAAVTVLVALAVALASWTSPGSDRAGGARGGVVVRAPAHGVSAGRLLGHHRLDLTGADHAAAAAGR
jgi:hypothetical protein